MAFFSILPCFGYRIFHKPVSMLPTSSVNTFLCTFLTHWHGYSAYTMFAFIDTPLANEAAGTTPSPVNASSQDKTATPKQETPSKVTSKTTGNKTVKKTPKKNKNRIQRLVKKRDNSPAINKSEGMAFFPLICTRPQLWYRFFCP